jgi:hypothetical protein
VDLWTAPVALRPTVDCIPSPHQHEAGKQIGEELHLAEKTVKNYVSSILAKLEVTRRAEAASYLTRHTTTPGS